MKIGLLVGNEKNAGDHLIALRSYKLLRFVFPEAEIKNIQRWKKLDEQLDEINSYDLLILAGGPGFIPNLYPKKVPLVEELLLLKPKLFILGMGWWGGDTRNDVLYNIKFQDKMLELLHRVENDTGMIGCRDWYTVRLLKKCGIKRPIMTGCPAWYNLDFLNRKTDRAINYSKQYKKICVSDPSYIYNFVSGLQLITYLKTRFQDSEITVVFHKGFQVNEQLAKQWNMDAAYFYNKVKALGISCVNISGESDKLSIYDDCDLHIGYRVHAHIYNLSMGSRSILIEEDGRGAGVNQVLGMDGVSPYCLNQELPRDVILSTKNNSCKFDIKNKYFIENIDDSIYCMEQSDFIQVKRAVATIESFYPIMINHIESLKDYL